MPQFRVGTVSNLIASSWRLCLSAKAFSTSLSVFFLWRLPSKDALTSARAACLLVPSLSCYSGSMAGVGLDKASEIFRRRRPWLVDRRRAASPYISDGLATVEAFQLRNARPSAAGGAPPRTEGPRRSRASAATASKEGSSSSLPFESGPRRGAWSRFARARSAVSPGAARQVSAAAAQQMLSASQPWVRESETCLHLACTSYWS